MPLYLVVHTPKEDVEDDKVYPPSNLADLARDHAGEDSRTRWIKTLSPDLHEERHFTLWDAKTSDDILEVMERYHFMSEMDHHPIAVQEWDPQSVLAAAE